MGLSNKHRKMKEGFCQALGWIVKVRWFGMTGYSDIDKLRQAKIEIRRHDWNGTVRVSILNKVTGEIDACSFEFYDYADDDQGEHGFLRHSFDSDKSKFGWSTQAGWSPVEKYSEAMDRFTTAVEAYIGTFR